MIIEQVLRQTRYLLRNLTWPDGTTKIFGNNGVIISPDFPVEQLAALPKPCMIINDGGGQADKQHSILFKQNIEIIIFTQQLSDRYGTGALIGSNRSFNNSSGTGLLNIEQELIKLLYNKSKCGGINYFLNFMSAVKPFNINNNINLIQKGYMFECSCSYRASYNVPPCTSFTSTGSVDLSWELPYGATSRFDYKGVMVRRSTLDYPDSDTGTLVYQGTGTSYTDNPGSGTWYYSIFVSYDENEDGTIDHYSEKITTNITI